MTITIDKGRIGMVAIALGEALILAVLIFVEIMQYNQIKKLDQQLRVKPVVKLVLATPTPTATPTATLKPVFKLK